MSQKVQLFVSHITILWAWLFYTNVLISKWGGSRLLNDPLYKLAFLLSILWTTLSKDRTVFRVLVIMYCIYLLGPTWQTWPWGVLGSSSWFCAFGFAHAAWHWQCPPKCLCRCGRYTKCSHSSLQSWTHWLADHCPILHVHSKLIVHLTEI